MPAETLIHYATTAHPEAVCGNADPEETVTAFHGVVSCFSCRRNPLFTDSQRGVGGPTPLAEVIEQDPDLSDLKDRIAALKDRATDLKDRIAARKELESSKNERGMYVIEEKIHHGNYRSVRRVEVYAINMVTMDCIIQSSAYCYGSWLNPENPEHKKARNAKLMQLVEDLKNLRENRDIGWSTFRLITEH